MKLLKARVEMTVQCLLEDNQVLSKEDLLSQLNQQLSFANDIKIIKMEEIEDCIIDANITSEKEV